MSMQENKTAALNQSGFSLVSAIFLLVALSILGAAMVQLSSSQHASSAMDIQGVKAYQAARAGIEWGLYQQLRTEPAPTTCFATTSFALPVSSTLAGFSVTVSCALVEHAVNDTDIIRRWQITATACNQPGPACPNQTGDPNYVQRRMQVDF